MNNKTSGGGGGCCPRACKKQGFWTKEGVVNPNPPPPPPHPPPVSAPKAGVWCIGWCMVYTCRCTGWYMGSRLVYGV